MKVSFFISFMILLLSGYKNSNCLAQNAVNFSTTPESYPGAMDGKIVATIDTILYPPPYTFRINELNGDPIDFQDKVEILI